MADEFNADVIVAGAGLVGLTAGLALAQAGLRVIIVDQAAPSAATAMAFDGRASAIAYAPWRMLERLGVTAHITDAQPINGMVVTAGNGTRQSQPSSLGLHFDAGEADEGIGPARAMGVMVENRHLRGALILAAQSASLLTIIAPAEVGPPTIDARSVSVPLSDGSVLRASLLLAADGKASPLRHHAGIRTHGWPYNQSALVTTVRFEHDHGGIAHETFAPEGPLAILPLTDQRANIVWSQSASTARDAMALPEPAFDAVLQRRLGSFLGTATRLGPRFAYPVSLEIAEDWVRPRFALIGDSAHTIHPVAGQGLNLGLKDVAALADVLANAHALGQDIGDLTVLERYERWRRFDTMTIAVGTDAFIRLFSTRFEPLRALGQAGLAIFDRFAQARRFFMAEAGGAAGALPRLLQADPTA